MDVPTFQIAFPTFRQTDPRYIQAALDRASRWVAASVWGDKTDDGIALLAAHWLFVDPFGTNVAGKPGKEPWSPYRDQFEEMRAAIVGGFAGGGTWGGWL